MIRVGRSYGSSVALLPAGNESNSPPLERYFEFRPSVMERFELQAVVSSLSLVGAYWGPYSALLVIEGRIDRCSTENPPLVVSTWTTDGYSSSSSSSSSSSHGFGTANLTLPLIPQGREWCITARANGSAFVFRKPAATTTIRQTSSASTALLSVTVSSFAPHVTSLYLPSSVSSSSSFKKTATNVTRQTNTNVSFIATSAVFQVTPGQTPMPVRIPARTTAAATTAVVPKTQNLPQLFFLLQVLCLQNTKIESIIQLPM